MKVMIAGSKSSKDLDFVEWYMSVLHSAEPIDRIIFLSPAISGDYKAAKDWACRNHINHVEYPSPEEKFIEYEGAPDLCLRFETSGDISKTSEYIIAIAKNRGIPILEPPQKVDE